MTLRQLASTLLSLPPILYIQYQNPMPSCSKALRGLSVLSRVMSIFTHTTISPGTLLRQCPSRYAIRAGRNLPDKEFRYLRTVIVTAARLGLFTATYFTRHSLSRSYGVILPSSLTMLLPIVLGFSPRLPVSVCGTGTYHSP